MQTTLLRACALGLLVAAAGFAGACGDDDDSSSGGGGGSSSYGAASSSGGGGLKLAASEDGGLSFDPAKLTAKAGKVTITLDNPEGNQFPHGVSVEGNGVDQEGEGVAPGNKATVTADLKPGTYEFYCPVDQHRDKGMEGTLTVS